MNKKTNGDIITTVEEWFANAPALPKNIKEGIVKITPIISLIFGIIGILVGVAGISSLTLFSPVAMMAGDAAMRGYGNGFISSISLLISSVLLLMAYPGVKAHKAKGWEMLFWSEAVNIAGSLISLEIFSALIGGLIGFYILFQIKSYYK